MSWPFPSVAMQKDWDTQLTEVSGFAESVTFRVVHFPPANSIAFPTESTAMQKLVVGHDTSVNPEAVGEDPTGGGAPDVFTTALSMRSGPNQIDPVQEKALPTLSTAMQKVGDGQETELNEPAKSVSWG
jgi:hypothetical protein